MRKHPPFFFHLHVGWSIWTSHPSTIFLPASIEQSVSFWHEMLLISSFDCRAAFVLLKARAFHD
jgi:hypothetical protein